MFAINNNTVVQVIGVILTTLLIFGVLHTSQTHTAHLTRERVLLSELDIRLVAAKVQSPLLTVLDVSEWNTYTDNAGEILRTFQSLRDAADLAPDFSEATFKTLTEIITLQSKIVRSQNDLMKIRATRDALSYRIDTLRSSITLITESLLTSRSSPDQTNRAIELRGLLSEIHWLSRTFWLADAEQAALHKQLLTRHGEAVLLAENLISGDHPLAKPGLRREMLNISNNLSTLNGQLDRLESASNILLKINEAQTRINGHIEQSLPAIRKAQETTLQVPALTFVVALCIPLLWTIISVYQSRKSRVTRIQAPISEKKDIPLPGSPEESTPDFAPLLDALEQTARGNISYRMNERNRAIRDVAAAYNHMMTTLYRKLVDMYRATAKISSELNASNDRSGTDKPDSEQPLADQQLVKAIDFTLDIAGLSDQLAANINVFKQNASVDADTLQQLVKNLDEAQARTRAYIRDYMDYTRANPADAQRDRTDTLNQIAQDVQQLREAFVFFKLEKRI